MRALRPHCGQAVDAADSAGQGHDQEGAERLQVVGDGGSPGEQAHDKVPQTLVKVFKLM